MVAIVVTGAGVVGLSGMASNRIAIVSGSKQVVRLVSISGNTGSALSGDNVGVNTGGGGWALSNVGVQVTEDGGAKWGVLNSPIPATSVESVIVSGNSVWVAAVENSALVVEASNDSGGSWTSQVLPSLGLPVANVTLVGDGKSLVGAAFNFQSSSNFSNGGWLGYSNASNSWNYHSTPFGGSVTDINGTLWLVGGPINTQLAVSTNQGDSWTVRSIPSAIDGSALTVPGSFSDGSVALVATTPTQGNSSNYLATVLKSSDGGLTWKATYSTVEPGMIGEGVTSPSAMIGNSVVVGGIESPTFTSITENGQSSVSTVGISNSSIQNLWNSGSASPWVETVSSSCPTGKSSCTDLYQLMVPNATGTQWQPAGFSSSSASTS